MSAMKLLVIPLRSEMFTEYFAGLFVTAGGYAFATGRNVYVQWNGDPDIARDIARLAVDEVYADFAEVSARVEQQIEDSA